ncbi:MAG: hypothetical protein MPJ78_11495 [Hyphomicrobiaceae bacterium]|nr:hypothetical protein [Hyphomicrobiaceae bacterium]
MRQFLARNEFKHDLFRNDLERISPEIEKTYEEIVRPYSATFTLYFYDPEKGAPGVDTALRLRSYTDMPDSSATFSDLKAMPWHVEHKDGGQKTNVADVDHLAAANGNTSDALRVLNETHVANLLKVEQRRHFAIGPEKDERHRMTVDARRLVYKIDGDDVLLLGDLGPRIEVKLPADVSEDGLDVVSDIKSRAFWLPFGAFELYMEYVLREAIDANSYLSRPEMEVKHTIEGDPVETFRAIHEWVGSASSGGSHMLPNPHAYSRARRYHLCKGPDSDCDYTVVETRAGRCSLKVKCGARPSGTALVRETTASHTTDTDGYLGDPVTFIAQQGLERLNTFRKSQLKTVLLRPNQHLYQFSVDQCVDVAGRILNQLEIEFAGTLRGVSPAPTEQILEEMQQISEALRRSPAGKALAPTHTAKFAFFTGSA